MIIKNTDYNHFGQNPLIDAEAVESIFKSVEMQEDILEIYKGLKKMFDLYVAEDNEIKIKTNYKETMKVLISSFLNKAYERFDEYYMYQLVYFLVYNLDSNENLVLMNIPNNFIELMKQEVLEEMSL